MASPDQNGVTTNATHCTAVAQPADSSCFPCSARLHLSALESVLSPPASLFKRGGRLDVASQLTNGTSLTIKLIALQHASGIATSFER